jgi:hypothetical protein
MKRFSLKLLFFVVTVCCFLLFVKFVDLPHTIDLATPTPNGIAVGSPISFIHKTKGDKTPVFYVKNATVTSIDNPDAICSVSFRTPMVNKISLWIENQRDLIILPGSHK